MTIRFLGAAIVALALGATTVRAQDYQDLRMAQEHLQAAWDSLRAAPADAAGHRERAVAYVNKALQEIHRALAADAAPGRAQKKADTRNEKLRRKQGVRDQRLDDKAQQRQERMQER